MYANTMLNNIMMPNAVETQSFKSRFFELPFFFIRQISVATFYSIIFCKNMTKSNFDYSKHSIFK